jgi:hypothetical protein
VRSCGSEVRFPGNVTKSLIIFIIFALALRRHALKESRWQMAYCSGRASAQVGQRPPHYYHHHYTTTMPAREPPFKRRRIAPAGTLQHPDIILTASPAVDPITVATVGLKTAKIGGPCAYCHRAVGSKAGQLVLCPRCAAPTCTVCTRTCSAVPPSRAPTPALSFSSSTATAPSTPPPPPLPTSPRRAALTLTFAHGHLNAAAAAVPDSDVFAMPTAVRRRRRRRADDGLPRELADEGWLPGCGRVLCRECCVEATERCVDLLGRSSGTRADTASSCTVACIDCCVYPRALDVYGDME